LKADRSAVPRPDPPPLLSGPAKEQCRTRAERDGPDQVGEHNKVREPPGSQWDQRFTERPMIHRGTRNVFGLTGSGKFARHPARLVRLPIGSGT
jgi:hypothetical protein